MTNFKFYQKITSEIITTGFIDKCVDLSHKKEYLVGVVDHQDIPDDVWERHKDNNPCAGDSLRPYLGFLTHDRAMCIIDELLVNIIFGQEDYGNKLRQARFNCELYGDHLELMYGDIEDNIKIEISKHTD